MLKLFSFLIAVCFMGVIYAQDGSAGIFDHQADVGSPKHKGKSTYDASSQSYTLKGAGYNIWFERDEFHYLYNEIEGDFIMTANFSFVGEGTDPHRKIGWMIRESTDEKASHASAVLHGDGLTVLQWRVLRGAFMRDPEDEIFATKDGYQIMQVERAGNTIIMRAAHPGEPLQLIGSQKMETLSGKVLAGLFMCSHNADVVEEAKIWNVRISKPVSPDYNAYSSGQLGCRLELMNVFDGKRKVIHTDNKGFEAPNWMPDGKSILFNQGGNIYTIPVEGGTPQKLDIGDANRNNNDHGISFDGKMLAISSSHRDDLPGKSSAVYVVPLKGGKPSLVTDQTPSYWHGWAPNNKEVIYVAKREGKPAYNLYRKNIKNGEEVALTDLPAGQHADGCEYSPDGEYIYYNGNHTGTMQIWRMKPDGTGREQLTFDENNDWFPHISPDGKWLAYISFPPDIDPNDHPFYKRVTLKLMPANGGPERVIAYLYGGQGSFNVPSWSPDSKHIAFVSNLGNLKP